MEGQPSLLEPNPPPVKPKKVSRPRKAAAAGNTTQRSQATRRPRKKKPE